MLAYELSVRAGHEALDRTLEPGTLSCNCGMGIVGHRGTSTGFALASRPRAVLVTPAGARICGQICFVALSHPATRASQRAHPWPTRSSLPTASSPTPSDVRCAEKLLTDQIFLRAEYRFTDLRDGQIHGNLGATVVGSADPGIHSAILAAAYRFPSWRRPSRAPHADFRDQFAATSQSWVSPGKFCGR
jgi:hypothetical protein